MAGLYEIRLSTNEIYYSDAEGNFLLSGNLIDTKNRRNLTEDRINKLTAVDFASLLLLGWDQTMLVAVASALSQCLLNRRELPPIHRTLFSMATLAVTVAAAGLAFGWLAAPGADPLTAVARPLVGAAFVYFVMNTGMVAVAIALTGAIVGELIAANRGLGFLLANASGQFDTAGVFAALLVIMALAFILNALVRLAEIKLMPWKTAESRSEREITI